MAYSRLASVEEKKNRKKAILFVILSILGVVALYYLGVPAIARITTFVSDLKKSNNKISTTDNTPPAPPKFSSFNNFTNQQSISLTGTAEPGSTVKLTFNGNEQDVLADRDGNFTFNVQLDNGTNSFTAIAVDSSGNTSQSTQSNTITFDNQPPNLTIDSPADGSQFFGSSQRQVTIKGTAESTDQTTINDRIVAVDDNGGFQYTTSLSDGANKFAIKAVDQAGNTTEKDITLNFTP